MNLLAKIVKFTFNWFILPKNYLQNNGKDVGPPPPDSWDFWTHPRSQVATWLRQQEVTGRVLRSLDEAELTAMGLEPFGRRRQLLLCRPLVGF